ncbi:hypothetical protein K9M48_00325 [Candidatus Gracilibacteria bacterium]|nr:hypothetical protein [Candidatus Gracilibacteria bacterium]
MPTINLYRTSETASKIKKDTIDELRKFVADILTCSEIKLLPNEVSIRPINVDNDKDMIAPVECDIAAYNFPARAAKQDLICTEVRKFLLENIDGISDAKVRLQLCELGHSI